MPVKDNNIIEKSEALTIYIAELVYNQCNEYINKLQYDLEVDQNGQLYFIRINILEYLKEKPKIETLTRVPSVELARINTRRLTLRYVESQSDDEESNLKNNEQNFIPMLFSKYPKKSKETQKTKLDLNNPQKQDNPLFVDMMAKTFEKDRTKEIFKLKIENKRRRLMSNRSTKHLSLDFTSFNPVIDKKPASNLKELVEQISKDRLQKRMFYDSETTIKQPGNVPILSFPTTPTLNKGFSKISDLELTTQLASQVFHTERKHIHSSCSPYKIYKESIGPNRLLQLYMEEKDIIYNNKYSNQRLLSTAKSARKIDFNRPRLKSAYRKLIE